MNWCVILVSTGLTILALALLRNCMEGFKEGYDQGELRQPDPSITKFNRLIWNVPYIVV